MVFQSPQRGIGMVEVLVTLFISSIAITGLAGLQIQAIKATNDASQSSIAMWVAQDLIERIKSNPKAAQDGSYNISLSANEDCAASPAKICTPYFNGTQQSGSTCDPQELASFDTWDVMCGVSSSKTLVAHPAAVLAAAQLTVECSNAGSCDISLSWQQQDQKNIDNNLRFNVDI